MWWELFCKFIVRPSCYMLCFLLRYFAIVGREDLASLSWQVCGTLNLSDLQLWYTLFSFLLERYLAYQVACLHAVFAAVSVHLKHIFSVVSFRLGFRSFVYLRISWILDFCFFLLTWFPVFSSLDTLFSKISSNFL